MKTDTIAAIATAMSNSGIGIVRISGDEALEVADRIFRPKREAARFPIWRHIPSIMAMW